MTDFAARLRELIAKRDTMLPTLQDHLANHAEQICQLVEAANRYWQHPSNTNWKPVKAALSALNRSEP